MSLNVVCTPPTSKFTFSQKKKKKTSKFTIYLLIMSNFSNAFNPFVQSNNFFIPKKKKR